MESLNDLAARYSGATPVHLEDFARLLAAVWQQTTENTSNLNELRSLMADNTDLLNQVATTLRDRVFPGVSELLAENARLAADNATLSGEDVSESAAATEVKAATDEVAGLFNSSPDVPNVGEVTEPTPDPVEGETPAEPIPGEA